jgi:acetyl-CoA carboxylase biotin carboxyl carrier protein
MKGPRDKKTTRSAGLTVPGVDLEQVEKLLDFMNAHGLEEFEYEHEGLHIRLRKANGPEPVSTFRPPYTRTSPPPAYQPVESAGGSSGASPAPDRGETGTQASPAAGPEAAAPVGEDLHLIKSPIVGTFYSAPSPDAVPYVHKGDTIRSGQVICIVEAMKLMNEIESDVSGEIVRVLVENKQPVEYGEALFAIRPDNKKK